MTNFDIKISNKDPILAKEPARLAIETTPTAESPRSACVSLLLPLLVTELEGLNSPFGGYRAMMLCCLAPNYELINDKM
jgi:hypothetical protein